MARPLKSDAALSRRLVIRLSERDRAAIQSNAAAAGLPVSEFIRRVAIDGNVIVRQQSAFGMSLTHQLKRIGNNLNQLAHWANVHEEVPPELPNLCGRIEIILDRIVELE